MNPPYPILFTAAWIALACAWALLWLPSRGGRSPGYGAAWGFSIAGFLLATAGFAARMALAQRAPVTNMYESILWAAWGALLFAMIFEARKRSGVPFLSGLPVAAAGFLLAESQPALFNAAIHPLPPVLRQNFWLATHVTTITLGYAALAFAMGLGHWVLWKRWRGASGEADLMSVLYGGLQIGLVLLGAGTVLGGFWAYQAWGRFWGWDPKETWALITLLCYAALLHGRRAGWWGGFGLAVGAVLAFQCVIAAWYGVNFLLGQGLHSYGWGSGGAGGAALFAALEAVFLVVTTAGSRKKMPVARD